MRILKAFSGETSNAYSRKSGLSHQEAQKAHKRRSEIMLRHKTSPNRRIRLAITIMCLLCLFVAVIGQTPKETIPKTETPLPPPSPSGAHEMTAADVEAFLDGLVPLQI